MLDSIILVVYVVGWITCWSVGIYKAQLSEDNDMILAALMMGWLLSLFWPIAIIGVFLHYLMSLLTRDDPTED